MDKPYKKAVFIFRRDLRLEDNTGLLAALDQAETVVPLFIFDSQQVDKKKNEYFSLPAFSFMVRSLQELDDALRRRNRQLFVCSGQPVEIIDSLIKKDDIDAVFLNEDYTPFARTRDEMIAEMCKKRDVEFCSFRDYTLSPIDKIRTNQEKLYSVFTPFMKKARAEYDVPAPRRNNFSNYFSGSLETPTVSLKDYTPEKNEDLLLHGGREEGLKLLRQNQFLKNYRTDRNLPAIDGTSTLSAHHKFGTISIRETYEMVKEQSTNTEQFISELYWRDFYYYIALHNPHIFEESFYGWGNNIDWVNDEKQFAAWSEGKTGVPMVDAGMRQLNTIGWMHNRVRMIVASYLTKNLLINWQWGEKYFAQHLIDYDPAQNNGGWQWSASTGADPRPLRIFNPYTQAEKYDPDAEFIKKWVSELKDVPAEKLTDGKTQDFSELASDYPSPLVNQKDSYHWAREAYKKAKDTAK